MLHDSREDKGADEWDRQRVGYSLIVLLERVFVDVEAELAVEVLKETPAHIVTLIDDDGILLAELVEICKGRTKHRVGGDKTSSCALIVVMKSCLYGCDVREDAFLRKIWYHLIKG